MSDPLQYSRPVESREGALVELELRRRGLKTGRSSRFEFRGALLSAQTESTHEWIVGGPAETGKTFALLHRLNDLCLLTPYGRGAIVRKVRADMDSTVLETWNRILLTMPASLRPKVYGGTKPIQYTYANGACVHIVGLDKASKVLSAERDWIYVNQAEELSLDDWEYLLTRVTGRGAVSQTPMLFGDCNPSHSQHWILKRSCLKLSTTKHEDNPTLFRSDGIPTIQGRRTMDILGSLTGVRRARLFEGIWQSVEGLIYPEWDRSVHWLPREKCPRDFRRRILSVDFGYTHPMVVQWWGEDSDGRLYRYRELFKTQTLVEDMARRVKRINAGMHEEVKYAVCDWDAEGRATFEKYSGLKTVAADKKVVEGIQLVQSRMKVVADGKPRVFLVQGSLVEEDSLLRASKLPVCTEDELDAYIWGSGRKEEPVKENDHGCDCVRYAVSYFDGSLVPFRGLLEFYNNTNSEEESKR